MVNPTPVLTTAGTITGARAVSCSLTAANTLALTAGERAYVGELWAVFTGGDSVLLATWTVSVREGRAP